MNMVNNKKIEIRIHIYKERNNKTINKKEARLQLGGCLS